MPDQWHNVKENLLQLACDADKPNMKEFMKFSCTPILDEIEIKDKGKKGKKGIKYN